MQMQKWPGELSWIRHGESEFNAKKKKVIPGMKEFRARFDEEFEKLDAYAVYSGNFPSPELKAMALKLLPLVAPDYSDYNTKLTEVGHEQAFQTGGKLSEYIKKPDVIYVSPYLRTRQTLNGLIKGWPELGKVKTYEDDRIREQEHGRRTAIGNAQIYFVLHPEDALLHKISTRYEYRHSGGESLLDVRGRTRSIIDTVIREHGGLTKTNKEVVPENALMVTHHLVILSARANLERWDRERFIEADNSEPPVNCGVTIYKGIPAPEGATAKNLGRLELSQYNLKLYS